MIQEHDGWTVRLWAPLAPAATAGPGAAAEQARLPAPSLATWQELHLRALEVAQDDTAWLADFTSRVQPCCSREWEAWLALNPPRWGAEYFPWTVRAHNGVNLRLERAEVSQTIALAFWSARRLQLQRIASA